MKNTDKRFFCYILASIIIVLIIDFFTPNNFIVASLYMIPVFIAAYRFQARKISIVTIIVLISFSVMSYFSNSLSLINILIHDFGILLFAFLAIQFSRQRQKSEQAVQHLQMFMQMITHDVSQPLTATQLYAHMLEENPEKKIKQSAIKISESLLYLEKLINDIKNLAQASRGKFTIHPIETNLSQLIISCVEEQQKSTQKHKIILQIPKTMQGKWDKERLKQVLNNLIGNAIKYSDNGKITVTAKKQISEVLVCIKDEGIGISGNHLSYIFYPYRRLEEKKGIKGNGLGLYISKLIIEQHHGKIWAESKVGKGSIFYILLPRGIK